MGFLTGAYLKMQTARMRLQLQHELTSIMSQMNRVTKQVGQMERMMSSQQRQMNMAMQNQYRFGMMDLANRQGFNFLNGASVWDAAGLSDAQKAERLQYMQAYQNTQQQMQMQFAQAQSIWADQFEMMREAQLQPLKDLEESLAVRKANIESRIKLIEDQEQAAQQMEKSSQKDFVPDYTGQG